MSDDWRIERSPGGSSTAVERKAVEEAIRTGEPRERPAPSVEDARRLARRLTYHAAVRGWRLSTRIRRHVDGSALVRFRALTEIPPTEGDNP